VVFPWQKVFRRLRIWGNRHAQRSEMEPFIRWNPLFAARTETRVMASLAFPTDLETSHLVRVKFAPRAKVCVERLRESDETLGRSQNGPLFGRSAQCLQRVVQGQRTLVKSAILR